MIELPEFHPKVDDYRQFLKLLVRAQLGPDRAGALDASDIVQTTLLEAHQKLHQFRGQSDAEFAGWLRKILAFNLADAFRAAGRQKRDAAREKSLDDGLDQTCSNMASWLEAMHTSPSDAASRNERLIQLAGALELLPIAQREAVELRYLHGFPLEEIGRRMQRSPSSVAGLLHRGLSQLREIMDAPDSQTK